MLEEIPYLMIVFFDYPYYDRDMHLSLELSSFVMTCSILVDLDKGNLGYHKMVLWEGTRTLDTQDHWEKYWKSMCDIQNVLWKTRTGLKQHLFMVKLNAERIPCISHKELASEVAA